ncbi:ORF6N domain-containing protein [Paracoccus sp. SY]|uniref:ORF6N domain-containing protein n=1 Tax=Paracoccus sp. SY TaxID=1330255 RepID=UPI000CD0BC57|nr:ORF6N domain-containing protein [Paracoccus sp. SY]
MTAMQNITNLPAVQIVGTEVHKIIYKGDPVITFAMVDEVHQRAEGTAGRNFRDNRDRFIEGEDFITEKLDVLRRGFPGVFPARGGGDTILLTKRGYLKLVKPMNDDRAWEVQGEMIDRYFAVELMAPVAKRIAKSDSREVRLTMKELVKFGKLAGFEGSQLAIYASRGTKALTGVDPMEQMGMTALPAPDSEALLCPSDIGAELDGRSGQAINLLLTGYGYQTAFRDRKGKIAYEPTEQGRAAGAVMVDVRPDHDRGAPKRQLRWPHSIVERLRADLKGGAA